MKSIFLGLILLSGLSLLVFKSAPSANANTMQTCSVYAHLTGPGATTAGVRAVDETTGAITYLVRDPAAPSYYGANNNVNCNTFTIIACSGNYSGRQKGVQYQTTAYITMSENLCQDPE